MTIEQYNHFFLKVKELRKAEIWHKRYGGEMAKAKKERLQREVDAMIVIEMDKRKTA